MAVVDSLRKDVLHVKLVSIMLEWLDHCCCHNENGKIGSTVRMAERKSVLE